MEVFSVVGVVLLSLLPRVHGGLGCFFCSGINSTAECHQIAACLTDTARCYTDVSGQQGNLTYDLGCREPDECQRAPMNGSSGASDVSCRECCDLAGCNKALCASAAPSLDARQATSCNQTCADDPSFDCKSVDQVFGICHDIHHAKSVCRKYCDLCCLVDGAWSDWSAWGGCSSTCGNGTQRRTRACDNPPPQNGGLFCEGDTFSTKLCTKEMCPVHGQWSGWTSWTTCSVSCDVGVTKRHRNCDNPPPSKFGEQCVGDGIDFNICSQQTCGVNGNWAAWGAWDACSETCGTGMTVRQRNCSNPAPSGSGDHCVGDMHEYLLCNEGLCPPSGLIYMEWSTWSTCTDNIQFRNRTCYQYGDVTTNVKCEPGKNLMFRPCTT